MTPEDFLNEFGAVANAPGGVQRLREMILQLAIQGKLVEQNPDDEPASVLLEKIAIEREKLICEGKIKTPKKFFPIAENEKAFKLPKNWEWVRLSEVGYDFGQKKPDKKFTYIDVGTINKELGVIVDPNVIEVVDAPSRARKIVKNGTVIYSTVRPYLLNISIIDKDYDPEPIASTAFAIIHPYTGILSSYIYRYLRSPSFIKYVETCQTGIAYPAINDKLFFSGLLPLPPLEEQKRIVAKVDQLMALCDQLEAQQQKRSDLAKQTRISALEALANAQRGEELQAAWKRVEENLTMLFENPEDVEDLKKCILQNAVMGKLVPQNPDDEPAIELLKKISKEKAELIKKGEIKRQNPLPEIREDEKPFEIPAGWEWCRLGITSLLITSGSRGWAKYYSNEGASFLRMGNLSKNSFKMRLNSIQCVTPPNNSEGERTSLRENDLLISITGDVGMLGLIPEKFGEAYINQHIAVLRSSKQLFFLYVPYFCLSPLAQEQFSAPQRGIKNSFRLSDVGEMVLPLPPFEEQKRIVEKTKSLLSVCSTLQKQLAKSRKVAEQFAQSVVEGITGISPDKQQENKLNGWVEEPGKAEVSIAEDQVNQK